MDSDDWIDSDFFEKLYNTAWEYGVDIAYYLANSGRRALDLGHIDVEYD